jgi:hypothetical protein
MYIDLHGLEIMVRMRCEDIQKEKEYAAKQYKRSGYPFVRRALVKVGGLLVAAGVMLEKIGVGQEVYHLSTTASQ